MNWTGMRTERHWLDQPTAIRPTADVDRSATLDQMIDPDRGGSRLVVYILAANLIALAAIVVAVWWFSFAGASRHQVHPADVRSSRAVKAINGISQSASPHR